MNDVYLQQNLQAAIGTADTRTPRALEVVCSIPGVSVTSFLRFVLLSRSLARKIARSNPRVDFYSTPSGITIVNSLNLKFRK